MKLSMKGNNMEKTKARITKKKRIHSLDITRGLIVLVSVLLFSIPQGIFAFDQHAEWYGFTPLDAIFPAFITIFGASMAIAYKNGINKKRFIKRTIKLILLGLIFNLITAWSFDLSTLRFTGVLQMFALLGVAAVVITKYIKNPVTLTLIGLLIFTIHGFSLLYVGNACTDGLPQPECNPSGIIDPIVFGEEHIYTQGERGYDPEGIPSIFAGLGNVLIGFAAGRFLLLKKDKGAGKELFIHAAVLIILALIVSAFIPIGKRLWTPSFGLLTAGITSLLLFICHVIFDRSTSNVTIVKLFIQWIMEAFGRNSFLIYFGKYVLAALLTNIAIGREGNQISLDSALNNWAESVSSYPNLIYTFIIFGFWTFVALIAHHKRLYLKI